MKKLLYLSLIVNLIYFSGCSDEDAPTPIVEEEDNSILLANLTLTIDEHPANGTALGILQAINASETSATYLITSQTPAGALTIGASTGQVSVLNGDLFEFSINSMITATVEATNGVESATAQITITLKEVVETHTGPIDLSTVQYVEITGAQNPFDGVNVGSDSYPSAIDLDKDGDMDFIIGSLAGKFQYFENNGSEWVEKTDSANPFDGLSVTSDSRHTFADVDGDGDYDLISGDGEGLVNYFRNDNGSFSELTDSANPFNDIAILLDTKPAFIDLDNDGDQDMLLAGYLGTFTYYTNENLVFTSQSGAENPFIELTSATHANPTFTDLDNDGDQDLIVGRYDGTFDFYKNESGVFSLETANTPFAGLDTGIYSSPAFIDVNKDGYLDLFSGNSDGTIKFYQLNEK